mmetsp:Transcript_20450/g.32744  ORF Transcript_20450/g.32744 Transcript_20450/m.32744 type:complete len:171 (+) Transcript_20450:64-576(+)|eukprot:CAMPEP_0202684922 /NCGR_PEP_ID=MMETSP1385-20130828/518_1 /ASSEMBLY_ACC=CAM_ASM_000861 /TAXON_ID=933848 /ORGANISM="Elphidium margaritaceum" /LENGTH=170 /DNA_ID=CAMNT_0049339147 /DNA_START=42 /DNA_END=554 /DNA_ORIENTATION=+
MFAFILVLSSLYVSSFAMHASCSMTLTVKNTTPSQLNATLVEMVQSRREFDASTCAYADQKAEFCGYKVISVTADLDHFQHETPEKHYVDDISFQNFKQQGSDVVVSAGSKSEPNSYYDYDTNFCNIFNLFRNGNVSKLNYEMEFKLDECEFHPDTSNGYDAAYDQCNTY